MRRAPILVTIRGFSVDSLALSRFQRAVFGLLIEPATLAMCTRFVTVTQVAGRRRLVRCFRRKYLGALHNAAPSWTVPSIQRETRLQERRRLGLPEHAFIATISGRMVTDKGIPTVLELAARLPPGLTICFVGDGPWLDTIRERYSSLISSGQVVAMGHRSDVKEILAVSDVFLFATLHENLSNALLEAMSLALPTIVTNVGGNPEVVVHGETGFLVAPGDVEAMATHLLSLRDDPDLLQAMGKRGRTRVEEAFSQGSIYEKLSGLYCDLLVRAPRSGRTE